MNLSFPEEEKKTDRNKRLKILEGIQIRHAIFILFSTFQNIIITDQKKLSDLHIKQNFIQDISR